MRHVNIDGSCTLYCFSGFVDFIPVTKIVNFQQNEMNFAECIDIPLVDDDIALEPDEQFRVTISLVETLPGLVLDQSMSSTVVNIIDNDGMFTI